MSVKPDELAFRSALLEAEREPFVCLPIRETIALLGMNEKRAAGILEKWTARGEYEYGVSVMAGWWAVKAEPVRRKL